MTTPEASRVLAVLGMHRSGTSWLAGSLQEKGLELGEVSTEDPHNRKGNRESPELMALHDAVLRDNGGSWKRPSWPNRWSEEHAEHLREYVARMSAAYDYWGFKDPRALLLLDEWLRAVPDLRRVGIFRHPMAVHRSLSARSARFDEKRSAKLWCDYNERLLAEHDRAAFPLLRFDVDPAQLARHLDTVAVEMALPDAARPAAFFEAGLVHNDESAASVPRKCRKLWAALLERSMPA